MARQPDVADGLNALTLLCKAYRALGVLICECREELQGDDKEGIAVILNNLTEHAEGAIEQAWEALGAGRCSAC